MSDWDAVEATPSVSRWDATPGGTADATPGRDRWDATPGGGGTRWDATPGRADGATPARKNRWDETPTPGRVRFNDPSLPTTDDALLGGNDQAYVNFETFVRAATKAIRQASTSLQSD